VWAEAAKWLKKFDEAVLTALDADGYPISVRVDHRAYDATTGRLPVPLPAELRAVDGPANLLCHYHDAKLWNLKAIAIKGRLAQRDGTPVFESTSFDPPKFALIAFVRNVRTSAQKYLDKRGLDRPAVNWDAVKELQRRAKSGQSAN
jgi:hypothetical protein